MVVMLTAQCSLLTAELTWLTRSLTHSLMPTDWYSPLKEQGTNKSVKIKG